jgi:7,8-dihydropterin-6-yl-methyl-4-(beta-D-ribofuranosyl)aminobenzene 5'-phosphate synthase
MVIRTLVENTSISNNYGSEHGLSLYIETKRHKILFDVGASGLFLENAGKMAVTISDVDYLIISHGHCDHGGGLNAFLQQNTHAEVFLHRLAFEKYYAARSNREAEYIGLEHALKQHKQIVLVSDRFFIQKGIQVFSNIAQRKPLPASNSGLLMEREGQMQRDAFSHEQNLVIEQDGKTLLVTGCAHNGIINILEHFYTIKKRMPDTVIGGFHLSSRSGGNESDDTVDAIGKYLLDTNANYYTCHCTGTEAYHRLKTVMGDRIDYLQAGREIAI